MPLLLSPVHNGRLRTIYCCHLLFDLEPSGVGITLPKLWIAQLPQWHFANSGRYKSEFTNGSTLNRCTKFKCITESKDSRKCTSSPILALPTTQPETMWSIEYILASDKQMLRQLYTSRIQLTKGTFCFCEPVGRALYHHEHQNRRD